MRWDAAADALGFAERIAFIAPDAGAEIATTSTSAHLDFEVIGQRDGLTLREDGEVRLVGLGARSAIEHVYGRAHAVAFDLLRDAGWQRLHGGVIDVDDRRVLIVGDSGAGKSTLVSRLMFDGADVIGDEWALVRDGQATSFARRIHLEAGSTAVVPEVAERWDQLDRFITREGVDTRAIDPTVLGRRWRLDPAPLAAVVVLGPRPDDRNHLAPTGGLDTVRRLLAQAFVDDASGDGSDDVSPTAPDRGPLVRTVCRLVADASCWSLAAGDLATVHPLLVDAVVRRSP